jgi:dTMP kinase
MTEGRGLFISFEGGDGSGKSTQLSLLAERLEKKGFRVVKNAEPGGTNIGQQIRRILLDRENNEMRSMTELLLMFASRAQAAEERILPTLRQGGIVLSDRFTDSSLAYQGEARGLGFDLVRALHDLTLGPIRPDLTICIDVDLETSLARAYGRNHAAGTEAESRLDEQSMAFHRRVREGYRRIAAEEPQRFKMVDGWEAPEIVAEHVWELVSPLLGTGTS